MKKTNSVGIILGLLFLVIGVGYLADVLGLIENFTIFFDGWWTLFIIVPCFCGLVGKGEGKTGYLIGIAIGLLLLLMAQGVLEGQKMWALVLAVVCVLIGVKLIVPERKKNLTEETFSSHTDRFDHAGNIAGTQTVERVVDAEVVSETVVENVQGTTQNTDGKYQENGSYKDDSVNEEKVVCSAVFSGRDIRVDNSCFNGGDLCAIFGGIDLNLKNALIQRNVTIEVKAIFGGIDILMPSNVRVVVDVTPILGGVENGTRTPLGADENTPTVYIKGTCMFGGVGVK